MTAQTPVHDTLAGLIAAAAGDSWYRRLPAAGERVRSLEVRWIFPGRLTGAVAGWFGRFPARTESREDAYLLDPQRPGVSLKVRGGGPVEVKVYRGSPGTLEVTGHACGRLEAWQKWPLALRPPSPGSGQAAGGVGAQEAAHQPVLTRPTGSSRPVPSSGAANRRARWNSPRSAPAARTGGRWDSRRRAPSACSAANSRPPPRTCSHSPCPPAWIPAPITPGPIRSGLAWPAAGHQQ